MKDIIWIIVSATVLGLGIEDESWVLVLPGGISTFCSLIVGWIHVYKSI